MSYCSSITSSSSLETKPAETKAGFIKIALRKNEQFTPYVDYALTFDALAQQKTQTADDFLTHREFRSFILSASGLSDKALGYLDESDKDKLVMELINNYLKPAGTKYVDVAVFRYLLAKGDTVGGSIRNIIGKMAQDELIRKIIAISKLYSIDCEWCSKSRIWKDFSAVKHGRESVVKAIRWSNTHGKRLLVFNAKVDIVGKNVDICLYDNAKADNDIKTAPPHAAIMFGELKGGYDPAGADEHWKTANTALQRIRTSFAGAGIQNIQTSFVAAAIEKSMATEIYNQLQQGTLNNAANLTNSTQLAEYCDWLLQSL